MSGAKEIKIERAILIITYNNKLAWFTIEDYSWEESWSAFVGQVDLRSANRFHNFIKIHWQSLTLHFTWHFVKNVSSRSFSLTRMTFKFSGVCSLQIKNILNIKMKLFTLIIVILGSCLPSGSPTLRCWWHRYVGDLISKYVGESPMVILFDVLVTFQSVANIIMLECDVDDRYLMLVPGSWCLLQHPKFVTDIDVTNQTWRKNVTNINVALTWITYQSNSRWFVFISKTDWSFEEKIDAI